MSNLENGNNPHFESSVKLCAAVKKYECLHDQHSYNKSAGSKCEEAWELVAAECNETVDFCKNRWRSIRRCFFNGLNRRGNKYYLHDHLKFLEESKKEKPKCKSEDENSATCDSFQKCYEVGLHLQGSKKKIMDRYEDDDRKSNGSFTTSADESNEIVRGKNQSGGVFIINEIEEEDNAAANEYLEETRLNYKRSCKRPLDPELIDELTEEEPEEKRSRKGNNHTNISQLPNKLLKVRVDKLKINLNEKRVEPVNKMVDRFTSTDQKPTRETGTQYEMDSSDFDDIFMKSIKTQINAMNGRQKMNFKRKIYESLLEVFDDAADFPDMNGALPLPSKQSPCVFDATTGELRLMRELVSLVQAAKITPEIINAKDMNSTIVSIPNKSTQNMPSPIVDKTKPQMPPITASPILDEDDVQFVVDNVDYDEVILPRAGEEPKTKSNEFAKVISEDNIAGLPRRLLQKAVRVAGPNGSTIVTRDGDKKRIYRIYPKLVNQNQSSLTKNGTNAGSLFVSSKITHDSRKDSAVGTFYVASTKGPQDPLKQNNMVSNANIRSINNKHSNNISQTSNVVTNTNNNPTNNQTLFQKVHPANRILSPTTGFFKMVPTTTSLTTPGATNNTTSRVMTTKLPINPMTPPSSNVAAKRTQPVRTGAQIMQRRFSICGPLATEKLNSASSTNVSKSFISTNTVNQQSQIQISQAVSLNDKTINPPTTQKVQNFSPCISSKATTTPPTKNIKLKALNTPNKAIISSTTASNQSKKLPVLETAGTVSADDLDPLFVKPAEIKKEPLDK